MQKKHGQQENRRREGSPVGTRSARSDRMPMFDRSESPEGPRCGGRVLPGRPAENESA